MITLQHVSRVYPMGAQPVTALASVDLEIQRGEFIAVMGPSGSGKSTLMHILGALDQPSSGTYLLEGTDITALADRELSRIRNRHFGFVFQSYNLFPELSALENVTVPLMYAGMHPRERRDRASDLLVTVGLSHRLKHFPSQMSGGEQQRVALARALANDPSLILADEPTGNLPSAQGDEILQLFCKLNDAGVTIVLVTHDPKVGGYGKRLIQLQDGRIAYDGPVRERFAPIDQADYVQAAT